MNFKLFSLTFIGLMSFLFSPIAQTQSVSYIQTGNSNCMSCFDDDSRFGLSHNSKGLSVQIEVGGNSNKHCCQNECCSPYNNSPYYYYNNSPYYQGYYPPPVIVHPAPPPPPPPPKRRSSPRTIRLNP